MSHFIPNRKDDLVEKLVKLYVENIVQYLSYTVFLIASLVTERIRYGLTQAPFGTLVVVMNMRVKLSFVNANLRNFIHVYVKRDDVC
ncbi:hypothetical protein KSP40_PGU010434 [Platanthera guangdongensis]|uniref:Uncharacterized protein n=1 Tax=Platanthera guangdongensis TaxID=2320717 RepID=A0ABR2LCI6_9ASPA